MSKINKIFKHFKNATLLERIKNEKVYKKRRAWKNLIAGNKDFTIKRDKLWGKLKLYKDSILSQYIFFDEFEIDEMNFLKDFIRKGDVVFDIGSNIGIMGLIAARKVGFRGKVYCFEPTAKVYTRLLENIKLNKCKNIIPVKKALSDQIGSFEFNTSDEIYDAWNSFAKPTSGEIFTKEIVETITLDSFLNNINNLDQITLIKIDVEGWEIPVLKGGIQFIKNNLNTIFMLEFTEENANNAGYKGKDLYLYMKEFQYNFYSINNSIIKKENVKEYYSYQNLIATKDIEILKKRLNGKGWKFE